MTARSSKSLFKATKPKPKVDPNQAVLMDVPESTKPEEHARRADDFYPTGQPEAIRALLAADGKHIAELGSVWEPAVGDGALAREIEASGLPCSASDLVDRGWPGTEIRSYYDYSKALAPVIITNPPFCEINARDGHGRWLRHTLELTGWEYFAFLLGWEWPAGKINGLGELLHDHPFSYCYLMRWKLDFTGEGKPAQRNAWFVWDRSWVGESAFRFMDRVDNRQKVLL